jgi:acetate kinase
VHILVLNAGSSSQKAALYDVGESLPADPPTPLWRAQAEWSEDSPARLAVSTASATVERTIPADDRGTLLGDLLPALWEGPTAVVSGPAAIAVVGHRVVHGGPDYAGSVRVTPTVEANIRRLAAFAPQHNPENLAGIAAVERALPGVPQVAVFDTAFHATLPPAAAVYPGPYAWYARGIRRYGFHGISHQYCAERAARLLDRDLTALGLVTCHLGNGCSLAAIRGGKSIDTTMGFTPLDGIMMGNRPGTLDPGILTYLMRADAATADTLDATLNHASGLQGLSGVSSDLRDVLSARAQGNVRAALAFDVFVHRLRAGLGAMLAALGGADAVIFAGGIGEHSPEVRSAACDAFAFLGIALDAARNAASPTDAVISTPGSAVAVLIVATQEDWMIARDCWRLLRHT